MAIKTHRVSRNEACPCGSGKKYKLCCLKHDTNASPLGSSRFSAVNKASSFNNIQNAQAPQQPKRNVSSEFSHPWFEVVFNAPLAGGQHLSATLQLSEDRLQAAEFRQGQTLTLNLPEVDFRGPAIIVAIRPTKPVERREGQVLRVVKFRDHQGDDLGKMLLGKWNPSREFIQQWRDKRRVLTLKLEHPQGGHCDIQLERKLDWIEAVGAVVGGTIFLNLAEMGARGWAKVLAISPCPEPEIGSGQRVTGTFHHTSGEVYDLKLASESKPLGVTARHPFWSMDRKAWVSVAQIEVGETLKTLVGTTVVQSIVKRPGYEPVYNIEVDGDHVYRVGKSGVLVHNASVGDGSSIPIGDGPCERREAAQTCTNERREELAQEKTRLCDEMPGVKCSGSRRQQRLKPCSAIRARKAVLPACLRIRQQIQDECFGGNPDPRHVNAITEIQNAIDNCNELEAINCAPGHPMAEL